jgi:formate--tetrahydrofolate ligase
MLSDIQIAQQANITKITQLAAEKLHIPDDALIPYGHYKAKVSFDYLKGLPEKKDSKLILVTAISPTPAGEGKTTTTVGLGDGLSRIGKKTMICLREPSLGRWYLWKTLTCTLRAIFTLLGWPITCYRP